MVRTRYCFYCGNPLSRQKATRDHVQPRSKGGTDSKKNIVDSCRPCNEEKGCLTLEEFRAVIAYRMGLTPKAPMAFPGEMNNHGREPQPLPIRPAPKKKQQREHHAKSSPLPDSDVEIVLDLDV